MAAPNPLSEQDLAAARAELSAGTPVTVWFTPAAVGVPAGGSAKLVAIDDAAEGDFIQVRPAGSRDTMFCSPGELTRTRPPRKRARPAEQRTEPPERAGTAGRAEPAERAEPARAAAPARRAEPAQRPARAEPARRAVAAPSASASASTSASAPAEKRPERPRAGGGRTPRPAEVTVTLNASPEGEWTVEVLTGKKRTVRATPVQAGDVAKAARALPSEVAEAIESSLEAARLRQIDRVERLRAELDAAQRALQELSG